MGLFKKKNGHKTGFAKFLKKAAPVVAGVAVGAATSAIPGGSLLGKVGGLFKGKAAKIPAVQKIKERVTSLAVKGEGSIQDKIKNLKNKTLGQIDLNKLAPKQGESPKGYGNRMLKGLGGAAEGFTSQASSYEANDESQTGSQSIQEGFTENRLPTWLLPVAGLVILFLIFKDKFK